jgi:DNA-binding CsgD family transcriptional regulator
MDDACPGVFGSAAGHRRTSRSHLEKLYSKLGVETRTAAARAVKG